MLSNVSLPEGKVKPSSVEFALDALPEVKSSQTGVSVEYAHDPNKQWFVLRSSYGREQKAANYLIDKGIYTYVARRYAYKNFNGKQKRILKSLIPNIIFVYTTPEEADYYVKKDISSSTILSYYYNHFKQVNGKNPPLTVKDSEMNVFIKATSTMNEHMKFLELGQCTFKTGEMVRVTDGPFKGVTGRVARVSRQQCVVVELSGIGFVSTAYIPNAFLELING